MKNSSNRFKKLIYSALAISMLATVLIPALTGTAFAAYGQVSTRSIQMSSSLAGASGVNYNVTYTPASATLVQAIVVDFCSNDPIIGDTCTAPTSLSTASAGVSGVSVSGETGGTWTAGTINSGRTFKLTNGSAVGTVSGATNFTITNVTNPNFATCGGTDTHPNCTFYARIFTFSSTANETTWEGTATGAATATVQDAGGVALSSNNQLSVTMKVQETLTFCVYTTASCTTLGAAAVNLGDTNGVLSTAGPFVDKNTKFDLATNANSGAAVKFKAPTLTSGSASIAGIGGTAAASTSGSSQFGFCAYRASGTTMSIVAPYNNSAADGGAACLGTTQTAGTASTGGTNSALFAFDTAPAATTYGDDIATAVAGASSTGRMVFVGNVAATQQAGIYTSNFTFIATGTY